MLVPRLDIMDLAENANRQWSWCHCKQTRPCDLLLIYLCAMGYWNCGLLDYWIMKIKLLKQRWLGELLKYWSKEKLIAKKRYWPSNALTNQTQIVYSLIQCTGAFSNRLLARCTWFFFNSSLENTTHKNLWTSL